VAWAAFCRFVRRAPARNQSACERKHAERFVAAQAPDLLVATHLNEWGSPQSDYVRAAKRRGVRTVYLVFSWDNLTNKGLVRDAPDRVLVWNELQKQEAVELQRLPAERIRLTGAPAYDHWFDREPGARACRFAPRSALTRRSQSCSTSARPSSSLRTGCRSRGSGSRRSGEGGMLADAGLLIRRTRATPGSGAASTSTSLASASGRGVGARRGVA
jgi:hypothetical protein